MTINLISLISLPIASLAAPQDAPTLAGDSPSTTTTPSGTIAAPGDGGGAPPPAGNNLLFIVLPVLLVGMWIFMSMGQRRETKKKQGMLTALKKHDRVQTSGGVIGSVVEVKPDTVVLKVDEQSNTRMTFVKSAIIGVLKEAPADSAASSASQAKSA